MRINLHEDTASVVSVALSQSRQAGLAGMLKTIAEAVDANGCILWQIAPNASPEAEPQSAYLFVIAEWFSDGGVNFNAPRYMPANNSVTGKAVLSNVPFIVQNIESDSRDYGDPFLAELRIRNMCTIPVRLIDDARGAVNLYRNTSKPFSDDEIKQFEQLARLIPEFYQSITDAASLKLIKAANNLLHKATLHAPSGPLSSSAVRDVLGQLCILVADTFQCLETSIFLEDPQEAPNRYDLIGTTWPSELKTVYTGGNEGLTGWVLARAQTIRIFDLTNFDRDRTLITRQYPGLNWTELDITATAREILNLGSGEKLPPLSFMAAPVMNGEKVLGVVRCAIVKSGPFYFTDMALSLLALVASQISWYWSSWLNRRESEDEIRSWRAFVESVGHLNTFVRKELAQETPDEGKIFAEALRLTQAVIIGAEIMDVRLLDRAKHELYFARTFGKAWSEGDKDEIRMRLARRFPIDEDGVGSAGALVFRSGELYEIKEASVDPYYSETFPSTRRMLIAPIKIANEKFGVLDIRGTGEREFPKHARPLAELLGRQLGLYSYLADTIGRLHEIEGELRLKVDELRLRTEQERRIFEDLSHQFRTPIAQAFFLVQEVLKTVKDDDEVLIRRLMAIRGLSGKAKRVSYSTELFAALARNQPIPISAISPLTYDNLLKLLIEAAQDHELIYSLRGIKFHVHMKRTASHRGRLVEMRELDVDKGLLEQAINDILDNAGKYSFSHTSVLIEGGFTSGGGFYLSFENSGIAILPSEVHRCTERGWQSEHAKLVAGPGSGIGLWIAHHIMLGHHGQLEINPTTNGDRTKIRLIFPSNRVR